MDAIILFNKLTEEQERENIKQFLSQQLAPFRIDIISAETLDDEYQRQVKKHHLNILVGAENANRIVQKTANVSLEKCPEAENRIERFHHNIGKQVSQSARFQAELPFGSEFFCNNYGQNPGFFFKNDEYQFLSIPMFSNEVYPMFAEHLAAALAKSCDQCVLLRTVGVFGLSEKTLISRLADMLSEVNPDMNIYSSDGEALIFVTSKAPERESAERALEEAVASAKERLGVNVYGTDEGSLQQKVISLLTEKKQTIAVAEATKQTYFSDRFTKNANISSVFECSIVANVAEPQKHVLGIAESLYTEKYVSSEMAAEMVVAARKVGKSTLGLALTDVASEEIDGEKHLVQYIAMADDKRIWAKKITMLETDETNITAHSVLFLFDLLRRYLIALPNVMAGGELIKSSEDENLSVIPESEVVKSNISMFSKIFPTKKDSTAEKTRKIVIFVALLVLIALLLFVIFDKEISLNGYVSGNIESNVKSANKDAVIVENVLPITGKSMIPDFLPLREINNDINGWIKIENTGIGHPIMSSTDENFYNNHNFDMQESDFGLPYFDKDVDVSAKRESSVYTVYGKNNGGTGVFAELSNYYGDASYLQNHSVISLDTLYEKISWKVVSVILLPEEESKLVSNVSVKTTDETREDRTNYLFDASIYEIDEQQKNISENSTLLFLVSDFYNEKYATEAGVKILVVAKSVDKYESDKHDLSSAVFKAEFDSPIKAAEKSKAAAVDSKYVSSVIKNNSTTTATDNGGGTSSGKDGVSIEKSSTKPTKSKQTSTTKPTETGVTVEPDPEPEGVIQIPRPNQNAGFLQVQSATTEDSYWKGVTVIGFNGGTYYGESLSVDERKTVVAMMVKREMGHSAFVTEALKAQAVATYSKILFDGKADVSGVSFQLGVARDRENFDAVSSVFGQKLIYGNRPLNAFYFASSPGVTLDNIYYFGANVPYAKPVASEFENVSCQLTKDAWTSSATLSEAEILRKLSVKVEAEVKCDSTFAVRKTDAYGKYVLETNVYYYSGGNKKYVTGRQVREALGLRSTAFWLSGNTSALTFNVTGHGHGVGMSQHGANGYAIREKWDYKRILGHYYSSTPSSSVIVLSMPNFS